MRPFPMDREPVLTPSIWILNHLLSSRRITVCSLWMLVRMWLKESWNLISSSAVWSERVEMIIFPWLLKLAATIFMCFAFWLEDSAALTLSTIRLGSGLFSTGMPWGGNWTTSREGWYEALGFGGVFVAGSGVGVDFVLVFVGCVGLDFVPTGAWIDPLGKRGLPTT